MKSPRSILVGLAVAGAVIAVPQLAGAAALTIDDTNPDDTVTIDVNDFEAGFFVNGSLIQQGLGNPASITLDEALGRIDFSGSWIDLGRASGSHHVLFVERWEDPVGLGYAVSDILNVEYSSAGGLGTITGDFTSDVNNNLGFTSQYNLNTYSLWFEPAGAYDFSTAFLSASAISDPEALPEPGTLTLMGLGLVGLGFAARRKLAG